MKAPEPSWEQASRDLHSALANLASTMTHVRNRDPDAAPFTAALLWADVRDAARALGVPGLSHAESMPQASARCEHEAGDNGACFGCGAAVVFVPAGVAPVDVADEDVDAAVADVAAFWSLRDRPETRDMLRVALATFAARLTERHAATPAELEAMQQPVSHPSVDAELLAYLTTAPDEDAELPPDLAAGLTERQRDGLACVACGTDLDRPGLHCVPVGMVDGGPVFLCAGAHELGAR